MFVANTGPVLAGIALALFTAAPEAGGAAADRTEAQLTRDYNACTASADKVAQSGPYVVAMINCDVEEIERQDRRLNEVYAKLMQSSLPASTKARIRDQDRKWLRGRDAKCQRTASENVGGTLQTLDFKECVLKSTVDQRMKLEAELK